MSPRHAAAAVVGAAAVAVAIWRFVALAGESRVPAYAMPGGVIAVASVAVAAVAFGALAAAHSARVDVTLLSIATAFLLAYGFLAIFSIGLPLLALGVVGCTVLVRRLGGGAPRSALAAGPGLALGLVTVVLLSSQLPVVSCDRGGVTTAMPIWLFTGGGGGSGSSGSGSSDSTVRTGTVTAGGSTFTFTCDGDRLVSFR